MDGCSPSKALYKKEVYIASRTVQGGGNEIQSCMFVFCERLDSISSCGLAGELKKGAIQTEERTEGVKENN